MDSSPLQDLVVIEAGQYYNGPYAGLLFALGGATVIKVEPFGGEPLRLRALVGGPYPFAMMNSNKLGVVINLKHPSGVEAFLDLAKSADVVLENFAPGVMERLGIGSEAVHAVNPHLVYGSGTGFGQHGPKRDRLAMDLTVQAISGVMATTGTPDLPPLKAGPALADFLGGIHLYAGILTALHRRSVTGEGATVDVAMLDSIYPSLMSSLGLFFSSGRVNPPRSANRHPGNAESPYNVYQAADGFVAIICVMPPHWVSLVTTMGQPELANDPRFSTQRARVENVDAVDELVGSWTSTLPKEVVVDLLIEAHVPCAPVNEISDVTTDPHLLSRGMLQHLDHPEYGEVLLPHTPLLVADQKRVPLQPSPSLGEHTAVVLRDIAGYSDARIKDLVHEGAIGV